MLSLFSAPCACGCGHGMLFSQFLVRLHACKVDSKYQNERAPKISYIQKRKKRSEYAKISSSHGKIRSIFGRVHQLKPRASLTTHAKLILQNQPLPLFLGLQKVWVHSLIQYIRKTAYHMKFVSLIQSWVELCKSFSSLCEANIVQKYCKVGKHLKRMRRKCCRPRIASASCLDSRPRDHSVFRALL